MGQHLSWRGRGHEMYSYSYLLADVYVRVNFESKILSIWPIVVTQNELCVFFCFLLLGNHEFFTANDLNHLLVVNSL